MILSRDNMLVYVLITLNSEPIYTAKEKALIDKMNFENDISSFINKKGNRSKVLLVIMITKSFYIIEDLKVVLKNIDKMSLGRKSKPRLIWVDKVVVHPIPMYPIASININNNVNERKATRWQFPGRLEAKSL